MKQVFIILLFFCISFVTNAQIRGLNQRNTNFNQSDSTFNKEITVKLSGETKFTDYKVISIDNDTTFIDTTLTIEKDYKFNFIRSDIFELLPFHNLGQTFNKLAYSFNNTNALPHFGFTAKQYNYKNLNDVYYYYVPTPTSELMYRTGMEQGQVLDAFLTLNTSKKLNLAIGYKGLRSLGKYRNALASHGNFTTSFNYISANKQYNARGHFYSFDLLNNENGGLTDTSLLYFETEEPNYDDRGRLETNFTDAENMYKGKRFYADHNYILINRKKQVKENILARKTKIQQDSIQLELSAVKNDSIQRIEALQDIYTEVTDSILAQDSIYLVIDSKLKAVKKKKPNVRLDSLDLEKINNTSTFKLLVGNEVWYQYSHYRYKQENANDFFGDAFVNETLDNARLNQFNASAFVGVQSATIGKLKAGLRYYNYNYFFNSQLYLNQQTIPSNIDGNALNLNAKWKTKYGKFNLEATGETLLVGNLEGSNINVKTGLQKDSIYNFNAFVQLSSTQPNFNKLLYQSNYKNYNWYNNFKNEKLQRLGAEFTLNKYGSIKASYNILDNYTYFNTEGQAAQTTNTINYLKAKLYLKYNFWKFTLANTVMYQKVDKGEGVFRVPKWLTRNSFYFSSHVFKGDPLYLQTGVTFKYFTPYKMNAYNPLLSEFYIQNTVEIGGYPIVDFFLNAQIQRTRLYLKAENITASFTGRNYYSAPTYPYRDFIVRFGLVWNFFI